MIFNGFLYFAKYFTKYSSLMGYCILRNISENTAAFLGYCILKNISQKQQQLVIPIHIQ